MRMTHILMAAVTLCIALVSGMTIWAVQADNDDRAEDAADVRISVRKLSDGRVEVALQQREVDGWGARQLPTARFLPADAPAGAWRHSSSLTVSTRTEPSASCPTEPQTLRYGFFAFFEPVSYRVDPDSASPSLNGHRGYEAELLTALEAMRGTNLRFQRIPIDVWPDIWLTPVNDAIDLVGGGITILDSRTRNASGEVVIAFTNGHINFRQSLLIRAADDQRITTHADLTADDIIGAVAATTGEAHFLQLSGIADADGVLIAGTVIDTAQGAVTADGSDRFRITAAERSPELDGRTRLTPPGDLPQVVYLGGDETAYLDALERGEIVGFARGEIGNTDAASANDGRFVVTALDPQVERGGFALPVADEALRSCLNERIDWLTDHRTIGYPDWVNNPDIFLERAQLWNAAN